MRYLLESRLRRPALVRNGDIGAQLGNQLFQVGLQRGEHAFLEAPQYSSGAPNGLSKSWSAALRVSRCASFALEAIGATVPVPGSGLDRCACAAKVPENGRTHRIRSLCNGRFHHLWNLIHLVAETIENCPRFGMVEDCLEAQITSVPFLP